MAYFYFQVGNPHRESAVPAVCALLHQLFDKGPSPEIIDHTYVRRDAGFLGLKRFDPSSLSNMWSKFDLCARDSRTGQFVCVLDGLDACQTEERKELLVQLGQLIHKMRKQVPEDSRSRIKFFLTSGPLQGGWGMISNAFVMLQEQI
ncbi:hypothetical protein N7492_005547 [Penicillium capsulatum]|uniref:Nephrocystin 3-like N-terminal domain-containing protein n=1 Tax=Penicillium capsulatum TaxID=69766 RepID=A0A9W9IBR5_9EURO|nr:hypothetical protein N7492_005547 [Penicillium capsulatum]